MTCETKSDKFHMMHLGVISDSRCSRILLLNVTIEREKERTKITLITNN